MRELNLDQLKTLISIIDLGTFSAAARALHLSQPTISLHIAELEQRFSTPLLVRGNKRIVATAAGQTLTDYGRQLLKQADDAVLAVQQQVAGKSGRVRLGTSTGIVVHLLPQVLEALAGSYPDIEVEVSILGSAETINKLQHGQLEIGLVATPQDHHAGLHLSAWRKDPMMAFIPASWKAPKTLTPQWLAERALIFNDPTTHMYRLTMAWFAAAGLAPRARIELNYTEAMKSLVAAGYGAAVLPAEQNSDQTLSPQIQTRPLRPGLMRHTAVAHRDPASLDKASLHLLEVLRRFRTL